MFVFVIVATRSSTSRCRGIPRGCVEVGQDHGGLEPRNLKSEEEGFLETRSSEWERTGESRAEADTCEDAGSNYVRERVFLPIHRCSVQRGNTSERERERDTRAYKHGRRHREARKQVERNPITITAHCGARDYSRIRASDGAQSLSRSKAQGDG